MTREEALEHAARVAFEALDCLKTAPVISPGTITFATGLLSAALAAPPEPHGADARQDVSVLDCVLRQIERWACDAEGYGERDRAAAWYRLAARLRVPEAGASEVSAWPCPKCGKVGQWRGVLTCFACHLDYGEAAPGSIGRDTERLDWLERAGTAGFQLLCWNVDRAQNNGWTMSLPDSEAMDDAAKGGTARETIDAAMARFPDPGALPPAPTQREEAAVLYEDMERRRFDGATGAGEVMQDDIAAALRALGISDHARPISPHEVMVREVIPGIENLRGQLASAEQSLRERGVVFNTDWPATASDDVEDALDAEDQRAADYGEGGLMMQPPPGPPAQPMPERHGYPKGYA